MINSYATRLHSPRTLAGRACGVLFVVLSALLLDATPAAAGEMHVAGQVTYSDGTAAPGAVVTLHLASGTEVLTMSDSTGHYEISVSVPGVALTATIWAQLGSCASEPQGLIDRDVTRNITLPGIPSEC